MEGHTLEEDFCVGEKGASAVSDLQLCSFCTGHGILPRNFSLSVIKAETIILCLDRVPISQETRTLLEILYNQCPQHPFSKMTLCIFPEYLSLDLVSLVFTFNGSLDFFPHCFLCLSPNFASLFHPCLRAHVRAQVCVSVCVCV